MYNCSHNWKFVLQTIVKQFGKTIFYPSTLTTPSHITISYCTLLHFQIKKNPFNNLRLPVIKNNSLQLVLLHFLLWQAHIPVILSYLLSLPSGHPFSVFARNDAIFRGIYLQKRAQVTLVHNNGDGLPQKS